MNTAQRVDALRAEAARLGYAIQKMSDHPAHQKKVPPNWSTPLSFGSQDFLPDIPDRELRDCRFSRAFLGTGIINALARGRIRTRYSLLKVPVPCDLLEFECIGPHSIKLIDKWRTEVVIGPSLPES